jgi:hypothetical protein
VVAGAAIPVDALDGPAPIGDIAPNPFSLTKADASADACDSDSAFASNPAPEAVFPVEPVKKDRNEDRRLPSDILALPHVVLEVVGSLRKAIVSIAL